MYINKMWVKRAARTFLQAFLGYIAVNVVVLDFSDERSAVKSALIGLAVSSVASGIAAVMNLKENDTVENG